VKVRVYYEDTDVGGIVYHANYLKFCERSRSELFFQENQSPYFDEGEFVVLTLQAKFKSSAKLGDMLDVRTHLLKLNRSFLVLNQCVYKDNVLLFEMEVKLGFLKEGSIARLSEASQVNLHKLFGGN